MEAVGILGTGVCKGEILQTNQDLVHIVKNFDEHIAKCSLDEWLVKHYGIQSRLKTKKRPSELAHKACLMAIEASSLQPEDIDFLILNTTTGDYKQPTTATSVQGLIGMKKNSFAIEINMPCAGNIYGIMMAKSFIQSGMGTCGLVVGVDKMGTNVNQEDFVLAGMFGDASAACVVGNYPRLELVNGMLKSKEDSFGSLIMKASGSAFPLDKFAFENKEHLLRMNGNITLDFIEETTTEVYNRLLYLSKLSNEMINQVIFHQASKPILQRVCRNLGLKERQVYFTLEKYGNTSSASVLLTLHEFLMKNQLEPGSNVLLIGMGAGLNWGGIHLKAR